MKKWAWIRITRDWKTRIVFLGFFLFLASFSSFYRQQNIELPIVEVEHEMQEVPAVFRLIPDSHWDSEVGHEVQQRLGNNSFYAGLQRYIYNREDGNNIPGMEEISDYLEYGRQIQENNLYMHDATEFESHEVLVEEYLPPREEVIDQLRFFEAMTERDMLFERNPLASSQVLIAQLETLIGVALFLFIAILAADHFSRDQENNWSVTQGLPISWKKQWRVRSTFLWAITWGVALLGIVTSFVISLFFETTGELSYPVGFYFGGEPRYISLWLYALLVIGVGMIVSYVLILFTTGLSWMIRNIYLTILIVSGVFYIPYLWLMISPLTSWQPSLYFNPLAVLSGQLAYGTESSVEVWKLPILMGIIWLIMEIGFGKIFSLIPTKTMGLKRRESA